MRLQLMQHPERLSALTATGATGLGVVVMAAAGAPKTYLVINLAALVIGLALLAIFRRTRTTPAQAGWLSLAAALGLLATALLGTNLDGASRWVQIGVISLQPGLLLLPVMMLAYVRSRSAVGTAAMLVAALAFALQPDRALAAALAVGLLALAISVRDGRVLLALAASLAGLAATLLRADSVPPSPFVEQVFVGAFNLSGVAGMAVIAGAALMLLPARALATGEARVFAALWLALLLAAAIGNYPTPLLGYGGSGIIGYLLGLAALQPRAQGEGDATATRPPVRRRPGGDALMALR
jgi:hypothetical protein